MATEFQYSIVGDTASGAVSSNRLAYEIEESSIAPTLVAIGTSGDELHIAFDSDLSTAEESALDAIVGAHAGNPLRGWVPVPPDSEMEPVIPGASKVVANDRPSIEVQNDVTGYAALQAIWPLAQYASAELRARVYFVLKAAGTGANVRIAARLKAQGPGDDSSVAFAASGFVAVAVTHTTVGEVFVAEILLDASSAYLGDAMAVQVGRDGANDLGAGTNDDVNQPIQIIGLYMEAR